MKDSGRHLKGAHTPMATCPLCESPDSNAFCTDRARDYLRCGRCRLVFVPEQFHLSLADERSEYDLHQNVSSDPGYRGFLGRLASPLVQRLPKGARGLDFGSGPGPTLSLMLKEASHPTEIYDPFYAPDRGVLARHYDFITATEVVEHLREPRLELKRLLSMLRPGGVLAIMTKLVVDQQAFSSWHYKNDRTHIAFFSKETFAWLGEKWAMAVEFIGADVIFMTSNPIG